MVKVLLCGVFILLAAILLSIGGTMLQHLFSVRKKCGLKIIGTVSGFQVEQRRKTKRYYPVFEFEIKGCRYQGKSHYGTREPRYRLHQPVALQVDALREERANTHPDFLCRVLLCGRNSLIFILSLCIFHHYVELAKAGGSG